MLSDAMHIWRHVDLCRDYIGSMDTVPGMENQMEKKMETGTIRFSYWYRNCMQGSGCFEWVLALYQLYMEHTGIKPRAAQVVSSVMDDIVRVLLESAFCSTGFTMKGFAQQMKNCVQDLFSAQCILPTMPPHSMPRPTVCPALISV